MEKNLNWYLLYTYPNYEKKVYSSLLKNSVTCFLPVQKVYKQWSDRKKIIEVPLFPNYLFVRCLTNERFKILDIPGATRFINYNGLPVTVCEQEIDKIKLLTQNYDVTIEKSFSKGEKIKISQGPFEGFEGVIFGQKGKERFCVFINCINRAVSVEFSSSFIAKLKN